MAQTLSSPGVNVSVIDQSFYTPAAPGTIPLIFVATAEDKSNASGTGTAVGTTQANAGTVWVVSSQRDLTEIFGTPYFDKDSSNNAINASEISEYGLQTAYSVLGVSSRAYVARADVDLGSLTGSATPPTGTVAANTYWVNTAQSTFGINEWNSSTKKFTVKTPLIIDDSNVDDDTSDGSTPNDSFGAAGDYAMVVTADTNQLWYKPSTTWTPVDSSFDGGKKLYMSPNYDYPNFTNTGTNALNALTGSVWVKTNSPGQGSNWVVSYFNGSTNAWSTVNAPLFGSTQSAIASLDSIGGGANIPVGSVFVEYDADNTTVADFKLWKRQSSSPTTVSVVTDANASLGGHVYFRQTGAAGTWSSSSTIAITSGTSVGLQIASGINATSGNVRATWNATTKQLTVTHALGGDIELTDDAAGVFLLAAKLTSGLTPATSNVYDAPSGDNYSTLISNWAPLTYQALPYAPYATPTDGKLWYNTDLTGVDILYNTGGAWVGYATQFPGTDASGPIVAALAPTTQRAGTPLIDGDIWVDSSSPDQFGQNIYVYNTGAWVQQDTTDHYSPDGWVFADARWSNASTTSMSVITPISEMLSSSYVDPDCVDPALYPRGTRLYNTRRSGYNVKKFYKNFIALNGFTTDEGDAGDRWVTESPNDNNGVGTFGRKSQRAVVVQALSALITSNQSIRDTDTLRYNLIAAPGYTEVIGNMVTLNNDIGQLALVVGDAPFRLAADATTLNNWGSNANLALADGEDGLVTNDEYTAVYYPSGYTNDNTGAKVVVPASHMMLSTIINSDNVSYPWFAPAGTRRGIVNSASSVGYVDATSGAFKTVSLHNSLRDVLSSVKVNPIATLPGAGLTVMGQYTRASGASALDRINVARLVTYIRRQLGILAKPFLFEPNDSQTRKEIKSSVESLLSELVTQRGLYDYVVVCDTTNNTPTRIDRNELWLDIAIEPVKSVEFIYIPLRLLNTGAIASGNYGSQYTGSGK